ALPQPLFQVLAYPGLSPQQSSESYAAFGSGFLLERETVDWFFNHYLRQEADRHDWRFAPLAAPDLAGVAPAMLLLPEFDPLIAEGRDYAARLRAAGVAVDLKIYPGMIHEFLRMGNVVPDALQARAEIGARLAEVFARQTGVGR
ncbi:MAG: alpha/beta hydrolase fold domain-containing protein, partial [Bradyrhizobium sp.]|nr:alpha/beta hydrolase fold domain-containing protein [Bradyrhizobium sp.]MDU6244499.1 alpha/beta hydrolase fold domain-containing protein [Bradyrhizobium sp.]